MPKRFVIYDAGATPVLLLTGKEAAAIANTPEGGTYREVDFAVCQLADAPSLDDPLGEAPQG